MRRDCLKVLIDIRSSTFITLLDSGVELNTIKRDIVEKASLLITSLPKSMSAAQIVLANGSTKSFIGIIWGVPIRIRRIEV